MRHARGNGSSYRSTTIREEEIIKDLRVYESDEKSGQNNQRNEQQLAEYINKLDSEKSSFIIDPRQDLVLSLTVDKSFQHISKIVIKQIAI